MTDNIDVVVKEQGTSAVVQSFDALAASAARTQASVASLQKTLGNMGRSTAAASRVTALGAAAAGTTGHVNNLNSALTSLNNNRITVTLNSANNALNNTRANAMGAAAGIRDFVGAWLSIQSIKGVVMGLIEAQITMQQIHYGLLAATGSAQGAATQFQFLEQTADKLGLVLKTSAMEYTRLAASANAMNVPVEKQQQLYTALSKSATVLHLDQQKVQFATLALTQMFSKGKIQAEELSRQLGEAIPGVVPRFQKAVMQAVKGTDLQGESFANLMKKGKLVTDQFLPQLIQALEETGRGWEEASTGLNAEINRLQTAWFKLKVSLSEGLFADATIAIVRFLTKNMDELVGIVAGLGVAIGLALAPMVIVRFIAYVKELSLAVWAAAGPWGLLAAAIVGVTTYLITMRDQIKLGVDETTTLGDLMRAAWQNVGPYIEQAGEIAYSVLKNILGLHAATFTGMVNDLVGYEHASESMWLKLLRIVLKVFDMIGAVSRGVMSGMQAVVILAIAAIMNNFEQLGNAIKSAMTLDGDGILKAVKANINGYKFAGNNLGSEFKKAFDAQVSAQSTGGLEAGLDKLIADAKKISAARNQAAGGVVPKPAGPAVDPVTGDKDKDADKRAKELERLKDALSGVLGKIDPTQAALKELADAQEVLNKSISAGLITQEKADWVMGRLRDKYKEQLDPISFLIDKYKDEREVLKHVGDEQRIQAELMAKVNDLKKKNYEVTDLQVAALRTEIELTQEATRMNQLYNQVLNETVYAQRAKLENLKAIADMEALGNATGGAQGISSGQAAQQVVSVFGEDNMSGTQEYYAAQLQTYNDFLAQVDAARQQGLLTEQTANMLSLQAYNDMQSAKLQSAQTFLGTMSGLMSSNSKTAFKIGQAAAIAEASINTYKAATGAFAAMSGIPIVGPFLGAAAAAAAVAAGIANISKIRSQQPPSYRTGGEMIVGGNGGTDSQLVQFNATPGEKVTINTPAQARALERADENQSGGRSMVFHSNTTIVQQGTPNNKTAEQQARKVRREQERHFRGVK